MQYTYNKLDIVVNISFEKSKTPYILNGYIKNSNNMHNT